MSANNHLPLLDIDFIIRDSGESNYKDQVLILKPESLVEEYRHGEFQLFLASGGFGCDPSKLGNKVFGEFLVDGEEACFRRYAFLGIADTDKLPDWAKEKLQKLSGQQSGTQNTQGLSM